MGRKVEMKKIDNLTKRQVTYSKRRSSLIKKANELSICCDIDVAIVAFSPCGRVSKFFNKNRIEDVIERYVNLSVDQRLRHIDNIEEKIEKLNKLSHINGDNSKLRILDSHIILSNYNNLLVMCSTSARPLKFRIENLELQVKKCSMELCMLETDLRNYEIGPEQQPSLNQLSWCEGNLEHSLQKVMARKDELRNLYSTFEKGEASSSVNPLTLGNTLMHRDNWTFRFAPTSATVLPRFTPITTTVAGPSTFIPVTTTVETRFTPLPDIPNHLNVEMPQYLELYGGMGSGIQNPNPMNQLNIWDYGSSFMDSDSQFINGSSTNMDYTITENPSIGGVFDATQRMVTPPETYVIPPPAQGYMDSCYANMVSEDSIGVASTSQKTDLCEWENWLLDENFNFVEQDPKN